MKRTEIMSVLALSAVVSIAAADATSGAGAPGTAAGAGASAAGEAAPAQTPVPEARIPFADQGGIYSWQVVNTTTILIQGRDRRWYKATLFSPCFDLPFTERVGFTSNPDGSFDKFSSIKVPRQNCPLVSLVESSPPKKAKAKKAAAATGAAASAAPAASPSPR